MRWRPFHIARRSCTVRRGSRRDSRFRGAAAEAGDARRGDRRVRRRLLLGRRRRVQARERRQEGRVRLFRGQRADRQLHDGRQRHDRPCRGRAGDVRPIADRLHRPAQGVLRRRARSDPAQSAGTRRGAAIPVGDLLRRRAAEGTRRSATLRSSTRRNRSASRSSRRLPRSTSSIRPRTITRTTLRCIRISPTSSITTCRSSRR